ncbi:hypothetical protein [Burkholderia sp. BCC0405]|uniref:hypothetical protein n=1 Tax=Burkholderia sp. BCC0405 TaxID=2676298 RepID=UPI00158A7946|nr:hypothetical protein [Burkholderia sp. BCC0405]
MNAQIVAPSVEALPRVDLAPIMAACRPQPAIRLCDPNRRQSAEDGASSIFGLIEYRAMTVTEGGICVRAIAYLKPMVQDLTPAISLSRGDSPVLRPLTDDLLVSYVADATDHLAFVQYRHLEQEGVSGDQLHLMAVSNLRALAEEKLAVREYGSIYVALMGGNFEASLLTLDAMWDYWYAHVAPQGFVAVAPARDLLAFCDSSSAQGLVELRHVVERSVDCDHRLSAHLYRRIGAEWKQLPVTP